jgi:hypothetical protein
MLRWWGGLAVLSVILMEIAEWVPGLSYIVDPLEDLHASCHEEKKRDDRVAPFRRSWSTDGSGSDEDVSTLTDQ